MVRAEVVASSRSAWHFDLQRGAAPSSLARRRRVRLLFVIGGLAHLYLWPCFLVPSRAPGAPRLIDGPVRTCARNGFPGCSRVIQQRPCRGKSQAHLFGAVVESYSQSCRSWPFLMAFLTCFVKGGLSNLVSQTILEKNGRLRRRYLLAFAIASGLSFGCVLHECYNVLFDKIFGTGDDILTVAKKVLADALFVSPCILFPLFFVLRDMSLGLGMTSGARRYAREWFNVMRAYWPMWGLFHSLNFTYTPRELRVFAVACMSFCYLIVLSWQSRGSRAKA